MGGKGGSSYIGGKAGAFRDGGRGSGVCICTCAWVCDVHVYTQQMCQESECLSNIVLGPIQPRSTHHTSLACVGDGSSTLLSERTDRVRQFSDSRPSQSIQDINASVHTR